MHHITLVSGSHRRQSQSSRVAAYLAGRLPTLQPGVRHDIVDLAGNPLPLWDESAWQGDSALQKQWMPYAERLRQADGLVIVAPEWSGMVPPALKNFFLFCTPGDVGHKPSLIVAVSSSRGGSHPVDELRMSSYKNTRIAYLPEHLIVRDAETMLAGSSAANKDDGYLRERADFALRNLLAYAQAMKPVRESGVLTDEKFPFGM